MYKFNEDKALREIQKWIDATYNKHYSMNKIQSTEFIADAGHGVGNIIKYAQRYGKKEGYNREDVLKIIHYAIILLGIEDGDKEERLRKFN